MPVIHLCWPLRRHDAEQRVPGQLLQRVGGGAGLARRVPGAPGCRTSRTPTSLLCVLYMLMALAQASCWTAPEIDCVKMQCARAQPLCTRMPLVREEYQSKTLVLCCRRCSQKASCRATAASGASTRSTSTAPQRRCALRPALSSDARSQQRMVATSRQDLTRPCPLALEHKRPASPNFCCTLF